MFFGDSIILSATGVQQDDSLGPVLFNLATHHLISILVSTFNVRYLDDDTLVGSPQSVLADFISILNQSSSLGLSFNLSKCELYVAGGVVSGSRCSAPGLIRGNFVGFPYYFRSTLSPNLAVFRL